MKEGWEYKKLGEVADFYRGLTYGKSDEAESSNVRVLRSNNIDLQSMSLNLDEIKYLKPGFVIPEDKKLKGKSIFICMSNGSKQHVGKVAYIPDDMDYAFGGFMGLIVPKGVSAKYIYYVCCSSLYREFLSSIGNGIGITNLRFSDLNNFTFPISDLKQQQNIVSELDLLSGVIEKQKAQLEELDKLAQSIFYDMFGDPVTNEKGWKIKLLGELYDIGSSKRVFENQWTDNGVPFYRAREIVRLSANMPLESPIFISEELYRDYSQKYGKPSEGDILVTAVGTLGVCYIVKKNDRFYYKDGNLLCLKNLGFCHSKFTYALFQTDFIKFQINGNANAAVVGTFTITNAKKMKVIYPPLSLQQEFAAKIEAIEAMKAKVRQSLKEAETLFNERMDYYFN